MSKEGPVVSCDGFEFMLRRDKLVPDSYWVCTVDAFFAAGLYEKGTILKVKEVNGKHVGFFREGKGLDASRTEQFLLLCRPLSKKDEKKRITWEVFQEVMVEVPVEATEEEITLIQSSTMSEEFPGFFCGDWKEKEE